MAASMLTSREAASESNSSSTTTTTSVDKDARRWDASELTPLLMLLCFVFVL